MKIQSFILVSLVLLVGCATAYQQEGFTGGFTETQLGENVFQITFKGNAYTSAERASDFTLLRSAELALEQGYQFFVIVDADSYSTYSTYTTPTTSKTKANAYGSGNYAYGTATTVTTGGQTIEYVKPRSTNTIVCFTERPEDTGGLIYEARFIVNSLKGKYKLDD